MKRSGSVNGEVFEFSAHETAPDNWRVELNGVAYELELQELFPGCFSILLDGRSLLADLTAHDDSFEIQIAGQTLRLDLGAARAAAPRQAQAGGALEIKAMMPGRVVEVLVTAQKLVEAEQGLVVIEAMKMENEIRAPRAGRILAIKVTAGQTVETGQVLMVLE
ncbi:MAG TPA: biotin/lipoyl-containing protein [Candidatus Binataceae bacterium]|nr:biotin/lipoyl-containing protein [Candidatus Binataceae bacterium]